LSVKQAEVEREETKFRGAKAELTKHISTASLGAASASHWCPISQVLVKRAAPDHFDVTVTPNTVYHFEFAFVMVQARAVDGKEIEISGGTEITISLSDQAIRFGKLG